MMIDVDVYTTKVAIVEVVVLASAQSGVQADQADGVVARCCRVGGARRSNLKLVHLKKQQKLIRVHVSSRFEF